MFKFIEGISPHCAESAVKIPNIQVTYAKFFHRLSPNSTRIVASRLNQTPWSISHIFVFQLIIAGNLDRVLVVFADVTLNDTCLQTSVVPNYKFIVAC